MKTTVSKHDFIDEFRVQDRLENFSYEARGLLYDYLTEIEESMGEEMELDAIAVCCDYEESTVDEIIDNYKIDCSDIDINDDNEKFKLVEEYLNDNTTIVGVTSSGTIVYQVV